MQGTKHHWFRSDGNKSLCDGDGMLYVLENECIAP